MNPYEIIEKYYAPGSDLYNILVKHSEAVRDKALELARRHPELGLDLEFIAEAAMLHDIGILETDAAGIKCFGTHRYIEHGYLGAEILRQEGLPKHAQVAERHTGTGITEEQIICENLPIPVRDYMPRTLEERLICYADKFYSKTKLGEDKPMSKIRLHMWKYGSDAVRRFDELQALFEPTIL